MGLLIISFGIISFFSIFLFRLFWARPNNPPIGEASTISEEVDKPAMRFVYHWFFVAISLFIALLLLPYLLSASQVLTKWSREDMLIALLQVLVFPVLLLMVVFFAKRRTYLRWIEDPRWPGGPR